MLIVVSPAKTLDYASPLITTRFTQPTLLEHAQRLIAHAQLLRPDEVASLMKISDKLAALNVARFASWHPDFTLENARQALFAFKGDVYEGLAATDFSDKDLDFAQQHLRILSGLYGVLRPLDLMMPYRLEMGTRLNNERGSNLYQFWGTIVSDELNRAQSEQGGEVILNLASEEYFKVVSGKRLNRIVITPIFKDEKNGQFKVISFYAKKARGMMARYIIKNRVTNVRQLVDFNEEGYIFSSSESNENTLIFKRSEKF